MLCVKGSDDCCIRRLHLMSAVRGNNSKTVHIFMKFQLQQGWVWLRWPPKTNGSFLSGIYFSTDMIHPFKGHLIIHPAFLLMAENSMGGGGRQGCSEWKAFPSFLLRVNEVGWGIIATGTLCIDTCLIIPHSQDVIASTWCFLFWAVIFTDVTELHIMVFPYRAFLQS